MPTLADKDGKAELERQVVAEGFQPDLPQEQSDAAGAGSGVNISPGSEDDGWVVPDPVLLSDGTAVQLYKDGEALHAAFEAIKNAKFRICLEVYIFASDETGRAFADLLCEKSRQGIAVYVIYDSFGSIDSDKSMFEKMRRSGVHLQEFHPISPWDGRFSWRPFNRDHRKLLLIDYDQAGLGGLNVGAEYAGSWVVLRKDAKCDFWRDTAIGLRGPSTRYFIRSFAKSWHYVTHGGRLGSTELRHNIDDKNCEGCPDLGVLASAPTAKSPLRPMLRRFFRDAKSSIEMTMAYFAPDDDLIDSICAAARRGVRVRLMLPAKGDVKILVMAARSFYEKLLGNGVEIYERQGVVLHAKTLVIDRKLSIVGSTNLDYRSIEYNCELSAIIRSEEFGQEMHNLFNNDVGYAKQIDLAGWRRRPWLDRMGQWAVIRARYLL
jgi:cardiolipin synthase A/B